MECNAVLQPSLRPTGSQKATLKFFHNKIPEKGPWSSCHKRLAVFPDDDLRNAITEAGLTGRNLQVLLEKRKSFFIASRDPDQSLIGQNSSLSGKKIAVAIDSQNLSGSLMTLERTMKKSLSFYHAILGILADFEIDLIQLYVNQKSRDFIKATDWRLVGQDRRFYVIEVPIKTIIDPQTKKRVVKQDLDSHLLPLIGRLTMDFNYDGLALFTGDSCYQATLEMWLGIGEYSHYAGRPAIIVTSQKELSVELREIANHPRANLVLLEDFYGLSAAA